MTKGIRKYRGWLADYVSIWYQALLFPYQSVNHDGSRMVATAEWTSVSVEQEAKTELDGEEPPSSDDVVTASGTETKKGEQSHLEDAKN